MHNFLSNIKADKLTYRGFILSFLATLLTIIFIIINFTNLPPFIPVFNQLPWGEARLSVRAGNIISVIAFSIVLITNLIFTSIVYPKNPLIARIVAAVTLIISVMNLLYIVRTTLTII